MTRSSRTKKTPPPTPPPRRLARRTALGGALVLAVAVVIVGVAAVAWARRAPPVPTLDMSHLPANVKERIQAAQTGVTQQPDSAAAWGELAMVYDGQQLWPQAVEAYQRAETLAPSEGKWPYLRALALRRSDRAAAIAELERAVSLGVDGLATHLNFGTLLLDAGQTDRASAEMQKALAFDNTSPFALTGVARVALAQGRPQEAADMLEKALNADATLVDAHDLMAQALRQLGRTAEADQQAQVVSAYAQAERRGPADPLYQAVVERGVSAILLTQRAQALFQQGQLAEAEALFAQAAAADPTDPAPLVGLGVCRQGRGDYAGAMTHFKQALAVRPDYVEAVNNLGLAEAKSGDMVGAERDLTHALELAPGHIEASLNLALVRLAQGRPAEAIALAQSVAKAAPGDVRPINTLAQALAADGRATEAEVQWRRSLDINPRQAEPWSALAGAQMGAGDHAAAIASLRQGLAAVPMSEDLMGALAWELATAPDATLRKGDEARTLAQTVAALRPKLPLSHDILAAAQAETGDFDGAVASIDQALALLPPGADAAMRAQIQHRADLFRRHQPFRQGQ